MMERFGDSVRAVSYDLLLAAAEIENYVYSGGGGYTP